MAEIEFEDSTMYECPVCLEYYVKPIRQCINGHSFCEKCLDQSHIKICPECRSDVMNTRNYKLEEILEKVSLPCVNKAAGCLIKLNIKNMSQHTTECFYRFKTCEGKTFCKWKCDWQGHDIIKHFEENHEEFSKMQYTGEFNKKWEENKDFQEIHLISAHYHHFWFKHTVDTKQQKVFWAIQFIGPRKNAGYYYYEFEIFNSDDKIKKYKVTEYCCSDLEKIDSIFNNEKCISISFQKLKNYHNDSKIYSYRFRLIKIPNPNQKQSVVTPQAKVVPTKNTENKTGVPTRSALYPTPNLGIYQPFQVVYDTPNPPPPYLRYPVQKLPIKNSGPKRNQNPKDPKRK